MAAASSSTPGWRPTPRASSRPARPASTGNSATAPPAPPPAMTTPPDLHHHRHPPERKDRHRKGDGPDPGPVLLKLRVAKGRIVDLSSYDVRIRDGARVAADALRVAPGQAAEFERQDIDHLYGRARFRLVVRLRSTGPTRRRGRVASASASGPSTSPGRARRASVLSCGTGRPARWPRAARGSLTAVGTTSRSSSTARPGGSRSAPMAARRSG